MDAQDVIGRIDHSLLGADADVHAMQAACEATLRYGFNSLCIAPWLAAEAARRLDPHCLAVGTVVGFPLGTQTTAVKAFEAGEAVRAGVAFVDMVVAIGRLKGRDMDGFKAELVDVALAVERAAARRATRPGGRARRVELRAILETGLLTDVQADEAALAAVEAGWDCVKTSTGFGPRGATPEEVSRLRALLGGRAKIKASGGIRTAAAALAMTVEGADYIGTGSGPAIADELFEMAARGEL